MPPVNERASAAVEGALRAQERKLALRFIICGSVDGGKSALIERLVSESKALFASQLVVARAGSQRMGMSEAEIDFSPPVDGLASHGNFGSTSGIAHHFFATATRTFIAADTPGDEQHTGDVVAGASTADAAVLVVDVQKGITAQTRRCSYLASLLGVRHVAVAVNKMDLVNYDEAAFRAIVEGYRDLAARIGLDEVAFVPVSALGGDNVVVRSVNCAWHDGPTLLDWLESVPMDAERLQKLAFRFQIGRASCRERV